MLVIITANIFIINIIFSHFTIITISHKYYRILYHSCSSGKQILNFFIFIYFYREFVIAKIFWYV